jgi:PadR family transcriptional regulator AphA
MAKISTTGYAILAMLSVRPLSTYELAQRMKHSFLRAIWPRAESRIYEEPKRLAAEDLAKATSEPSGDRPRTLYSLTRKGRTRLGKWMREPNQTFRYRSEALVKVAFADLGTRDDLRRHIDEIRSQALDDARGFLAFAEHAVANGATRGDRVHLSALTDAFILEMIEARLRWADFADDFAGSWRAPSGGKAKERQAHEWWVETEARLRALVGDEG